MLGNIIHQARGIFYAHWGRDKMAAILAGGIFKRIFVDKKCLKFDLGFTEICSYML